MRRDGLNGEAASEEPLADNGHSCRWLAYLLAILAHHIAITRIIPRRKTDLTLTRLGQFPAVALLDFRPRRRRLVGSLKHDARPGKQTRTGMTIQRRAIRRSTSRVRYGVNAHADGGLEQAET